MSSSIMSIQQPCSTLIPLSPNFIVLKAKRTFVIVEDIGMGWVWGRCGLLWCGFLWWCFFGHCDAGGKMMVWRWSVDVDGRWGCGDGGFTERSERICYRYARFQIVGSWCWDLNFVVDRVQCWRWISELCHWSVSIRICFETLSPESQWCLQLCLPPPSRG